MAISNTIGSTNNIIQSFEEDKKNHISTAEKEQIVKSRIGQSVIRNKLLFLKKHCELCSIKQEELLVASHIKPWAESDNFERGDKDNLLLLCAMHDALFDKGFISFDEEGKILISEEIKRDELKKYMLYENMKISVDDTKKKYLSFHRENIFRAFPANIKNVNSLLWTTSITGDEGDWGKSFPPRKIKIMNIIGKRSRK